MVEGPEQKQEWGIFNCLVPILAIVLAIVGWRLAAPHGWLYGILGALLGFVLSIPTVGLFALVIFGIAYLTGGFREDR